MYELSRNLEKRIKALVESEPTTNDFTKYTVELNGETVSMTQPELDELQKRYSEIIDGEMKELSDSMGDNPENKMQPEEFEKWFEENVKPKLDVIEISDHDFDVVAFNDAANIYYKETKEIRAQFKDEIIAHYHLEDNRDAELWIMESGGEGIPTLDIPTVIKAFDELADSSDAILEA